MQIFHDFHQKPTVLHLFFLVVGSWPTVVGGGVCGGVVVVVAAGFVEVARFPRSSVNHACRLKTERDEKINIQESGKENN